VNKGFIEEVTKLSGGLTEEERALLAEMKPAVEKHADALIDAFYGNLEQNARTREILHAKPGRIARLKAHLRDWLSSLVGGSYDADYFDRRYRIGYRHVDVGLDPRYVIAAMAWCRAKAVEMIIEPAYGDAPDKDARCMVLNKVMDLDLNIMLKSYDDKRIEQFQKVTGFSKELFENMLSEEG
jgi:hypothetical protein